MWLQLIVGSIAVIVVWTVLDFIIHGLVLKATYQATEHLWRPIDEMKMWLIHVVNAISAISFALIYQLGFVDASLITALLLGLLLGVVRGIGMGFGTYATQPVPLNLAWVWFVGTVVASLAAGLTLYGVHCLLGA